MDETADESIRSYGDSAPAYCGRDSDLLYSDTLAPGNAKKKKTKKRHWMRC